MHEHAKPRPDWPKVLAQRPQVLVYSYRQSPVYLDPDRFNVHLTPGIVTFNDPPPIQSGMINIVLDAQGRLSYLQAIPDEVETNPPPAHPVDWKPLFAAAGLDPAEFQSAAPTRLSLAAFDERAAWTGFWPGTDFPLRIEAAAWRGKPVFFHLIGPWTTPDRTQYENLTPGQHASQIIEVIMAILLLAAGALMARRNYVKGKSDVRGAFRLASAVLVINMALWVSSGSLHSHPRHLWALRHGRQHRAVSLRCHLDALCCARTLRAAPLAARDHLLEPPRWLARLRDPLVGRDILWGILLGVLWSVIVGVGFLFLKREGATPQLPNSDLLMGSRQVLGSSLQNIGREHRRHSSVFLPDFPAASDSSQ